MSLSVGRALRDGLGRTFERGGLQLVAAFVVLRLASRVVTDTLNRANVAAASEVGGVGSGPLSVLAEAPTPFALAMGLGAAYLAFLAVAVVAEAVRIVAVRMLYREPADAVRGTDARRLATATVNGVVGGLLVVTLTAIGLALLVAPGVFLAVSFVFVRQEIAVRDVGFVEAMGGSWDLARGHRLALAGLLAVLVLASLGAVVVGVVAGLGSPAGAAVATAVVEGVVAVFGVASVTGAYRQLTAAAEEPADDEFSYEGALTADDLPPPDAGQGRP